MSYRNPTQYIDRSLGKDVQQLQNTITSSFRSFGESYAKRQKEAATIIKKETARRKKLTTDLEAKKLTLNKGFADLKENNNSYDFQKILGNELKVYNEYATSLINNTIDDPKEIARRKHRMAEIEGLPGSLKTDLGVIGSYSEGMDEKMNAANTFGGYYLGGKAQGLEYMQVLTNNLKGARNVNLQWDNEKGSYNISYVNTPEGGEPISVNSRDLRAGEVGAKELVATIPDPTENQKAALKASGLYTNILLKDGKEKEVLNESYLQKEETIPDPNVKGGKLRVQKVDKNKFINNPQVVQAAKAYIDGLDPDDREALNNGIFAPQKDKDEFYIPSYGDDEETNKANDALVLKNYIQYQADRIPLEKVLEEIKPKTAPDADKPTKAQSDRAKNAEYIAGEVAEKLYSGVNLEDSLIRAKIPTENEMTEDGTKDGKVIGYYVEKGGKRYEFLTYESDKEKARRILEYDGRLSAIEINDELEKLFPLGSEDSSKNSSEDLLNPFKTKN